MANSKVIFYGETLIDLTQDTVEADALLAGYTAHDKNGEPITGTLALNFAVVGGEVQPASPGEGTIWVNTAAAIPSYVFSAAAPSAPVEGMVWLLTGLPAAATMSIVNGAVLLPVVSALQYVSGSWVKKSAQIYQSGAWADLAVVLLPPSANWAATKIYNDTTYALGSVELTDTGAELSAGHMQGAGICPDTLIDFTSSATLRVYFELGQALTSAYTFVVYIDTTRLAVNPAAVKMATSADAALGYVELDVSSVNGSYLILAGLTNWTTGTTVTGRITKAVLS